MLRTALESSGYDVTITNSVDALEKFLLNQPDLVITDLAMPGMDGIELTRAIREQHRRPSSC